MTTLERLLDSLSRVYDTGADPVLGLRLSYLDGQMTWTIADDVLTTAVVGGVGDPLTVDLSQYTLSTLAVFLASQPGYVVLFLEDTGLSSLSALALVPDSNDIAVSNGDHLYLARNPTWTMLAAVAKELDAARIAIAAMPDEMATTTADGTWLDLLGSYYAVPRQLGENDPQYSLRIPAEVILPRQNNTAIAAALEATTGQDASCDDAPIFGNPEPAYDGRISFSGAPHFYNAAARVILNLFDISIGYDLLGGLSPVDFAFFIGRQVDRLRAAGTHLRQLTLGHSVMRDRFNAPSDTFVLGQVTTLGLQGTGQSFDSASALGLFPTTLVPLSYSSDTARGTLSTGIALRGTGQSVNRVALPLGAASGAGANSAIAYLSTQTVIGLIGTGSGTNSALGALSFDAGLALSSSFNSATGALTARITLSSSRSGANSATGSLTSRIILSGTGSDANSAPNTLTTAIVLAGTGSNANAGTLLSGAFSSQFSLEFQSVTSAISLSGTGSSANAGTLLAGEFSNEFSTEFRR